MKLKRFIISIPLLFIAVKIFACGGYRIYPSEHHLYRVYCDSLKFDILDNLKIKPLADYILETHEGKEYMALAKRCESARNEISLIWYYPSSECQAEKALEDIIQKSLNYKGKLLRDRYALQAARAMFSLKKYKEMCVWWDNTCKTIPEGVVKENIKGYIAGALFRTGNHEKAIKHYVKTKDLKSLIYCMKKMRVYKEGLSILEYAASYFPDNPYLPEMMECYFKPMEYSFDMEKVEHCYKICMKAANNPICKNPDKWLYTAAFLKNLIGQPYVALNILARAEMCKSDDFMVESIKCLRILLDAQISTYNKAYEHKLLEEIKWLDNKVKNNLCDSAVEQAISGDNLITNSSYNYWNDMLRKIVLGTVVPRMIEAGKTPLALLLANYADNRMLELSESYIQPAKQSDTTGWYITISDLRSSADYFNGFDYSNNYFQLLDFTNIYWLKQYEKIIDSPVSMLEKFLCERAYLNKDYLNELIGTRYLREMNYAEAVKYLSRVSNEYQQRTNVSEYLNRNPFAFDRELLADSTSTAKLDFAKKMLEYQTIVKNGSDDEKGEAMVMMGIGIRSSFSHCWALTQYHDFCGDEWYTNCETIRARAVSLQLIDHGLTTIKNPEIAAVCNLRLYRFNTIAKDYANTMIGRYIISRCDQLMDYR